MSTIELEGKHGVGLVAVIDDEDLELLRRYKWNVKVTSHPEGRPVQPVEAYTSYVEVETGTRVKRSMQRMVLGLKPGDKTKVKHSNSDVFDNRKTNLIEIEPKKKKRKLRELKIGPSHSYRGQFDSPISPADIFDPISGPGMSAVDPDAKEDGMTQSEEIKKEKEKRENKEDEKDKLIHKVIDIFIAEDEMFSSVDISNHIKILLKTWVRNTEVTNYLRKNFFEIHKLNKTNTIMDSIKNITGTLYYVDGADPKDYTGADQKAMTPPEFDLIVNGG
jgi:hypothetical protein